MTLTLRQRTYQIFFHGPDSNDPITRVDDYGVPMLIAIDVAALILESFAVLEQTYARWFELTELAIVSIFMMEYLLRLWSCVEEDSNDTPLRGRLRYALSAPALVDLAAFLPFFALSILPLEWAVIADPFFRLLRLLKLTRYSESTQIFFRVLWDKRDELLTTLFVVMTLLVIASSLMYFIEREAQPQEFSSIPAAMWWGVITLTTVGYGDVYPITPLGKFLSAILAFLGIGVFALPARDLATAFSDEMRERRECKSAGVDGIVEAEDSLQPCVNERLRETASAAKAADEVLEAEVEAAAELMQLCVAAAKRHLGDEFESEEVLRDLAIVLFHQLHSSPQSVKTPQISDHSDRTASD